jgi:hypothetical protein
MYPGLVVTLGVVLVFSDIVGIGVLSAHIASHAKQRWLVSLIILLTAGILYCMRFLCTPINGHLQIIFLERLPYEVGMLLGLGLLWIQWMIQVVSYWRRRPHSPMIFLILNTLTIGQIINLIGIGVIFCFAPTMMIIQEGLSNSPSTSKSEWIFELGWLTYFSLAFVTPLLLLSLRTAPKFWQIRHWLSGFSSLGIVAWWIYWLNCTDIGQLLSFNRSFT